jgi:hypothetical protein
MTLAAAAREYIWLWDNRHGVSTAAIAAREGLSTGRVKEGLARARRLDRPDPAAAGVLRSPRLIPLFPLDSYVPASACAHRRSLRVGSLFCCMVCHRSGIDGHPALQRDPRTDPAPEPKPSVMPAKKPARETRKQKRARLFAVIVAAVIPHG